jgi:hypothetical protein
MFLESSQRGDSRPGWADCNLLAEVDIGRCSIIGRPISIILHKQPKRNRNRMMALMAQGELTRNNESRKGVIKTVDTNMCLNLFSNYGPRISSFSLLSRFRVEGRCVGWLRMTSEGQDNRKDKTKNGPRSERNNRRVHSYGAQSALIRGLLPVFRDRL